MAPAVEHRAAAFLSAERPTEEAIQLHALQWLGAAFSRKKCWLLCLDEDNFVVSLVGFAFETGRLFLLAPRPSAMKAVVSGPN